MPIVDTKHGKIEGSSEDGLSVFRGIPYAMPPTGSRRFLPPQELESSINTCQAREFGSAAPQIRSKLAPEITENMSEDCLSLNVWSPGCDDQQRPVMVWIHGGSFLVGASKNGVSDGAQIAQRGDIVVVSINYRVGAFGFLHLADIAGADYVSSGNIGLLDQIAALKWVKENINHFGGNPDNVTVFGCSAGGISISALMAMPAAHGLFHRAITQSGASLARSAASASTAADLFMNQAGATNVEDLRAMSMEQMIDAQASSLASSPKPDVFFGPVVDGTALPEAPLHAIAEGRAMKIPLLTGTTLDEMRFWLLHSSEVVTIAPDKLMHVLTRLTGDRADSLLAAHKAHRPDADDSDISVAILGDISFTLPATRMMEAHSSQQPDSWMYLFAWPSPAVGGSLGTPHAIEQPFVFGTLDSPFAKVFLAGGEGLESLSTRVQDAWIAFAKAGDPNHPGLPHWPAYNADSRSVMRFDTECTTLSDPLGDIRRQWDGVPFDGISPPVGIRPSPHA
ncbi:MAG: carboxylesterase/lipase family protein [Candidatus Hydrogenedentota bacterium]